MPDPPVHSKRSPLRPSNSDTVTGMTPYAELHCRTNFSFLEGASHPDELVQQAVKLGYQALAITDRNSLAGVVRAYAAARETDLKLLIGTEVTPRDAAPILLLATDRTAYGRLCRLLTTGRRRAPKGECALTIPDIAEQASGVLGVLPLQSCAREQWATQLQQYREIFGDRCYALVERHHGANDLQQLQAMQTVATECGVPLAAGNDVHYHVPQRRFLQDVVTAIRHSCPVADLGAKRFPNGERYLKSPQQMRELFVTIPGAVERTIEIADRCTFHLSELKYEYPSEYCPANRTPIEYLTELTMQGAQRRYPNGIPVKVRQTLEHELNLIEEMQYEPYFLTVWDLVTFARSRGILCQGRGSAANSAVCFCLGVTSVDPAQIDLLFERFISKERAEAPDIDVDFEHERREEVIQYVYEKYGRERAGMAATVITYRARSAMREIAKVLGFSADRVSALAKTVDRDYHHSRLPQCLREAGLDPQSRTSRQLMLLLQELVGFPRHLSQHVGGMTMTQGPLCEMVPIENAAMPGRTVIQWDKDDLDTLGILKVDCLSLGMLSAIRKSFELIERHYDRQLDLAAVHDEDAQVYDMISNADTVGVFQIESRAQMSMLPRLRPRKFYDLVVEVAIVRPGPIQGDMVHPYLRRRNGEEPVEYPDERIKTVLHKTEGVPIFQEQAMRLAVVAAGFTPGEADQLRRAMAAWKRKGGLEPFREKLISGMQQQGYDPEFGERLYNQIKGFGDYGFPESHAASFALLAYASAWLKYHYPEVFTAALINSQPMGFYGPSQLITDARRHHVVVRPVDVNFSDWDCTLESLTDEERVHAQTPQYALRLGFRLVSGLPVACVEKIMAARSAKPFVSFEDFVHRSRLNQATLTRLARADAFGAFKISRRSATWKALVERPRSTAQQPTLFDHLENQEPDVCLPQMSDFQEVAADYMETGLTLRQHPLSFLREHLNERRIKTAAQLLETEHGARVCVAGMVLLRQRPGTANGVTFVTLEDETGTINLIFWKSVWDRYRLAARGATVMLVHGELQRQHNVVHVVVNRLRDISDQLREIDARSRDFH